MHSNISKLDASMLKCGINYLFSYVFCGSIDAEILQKSVTQAIKQVQRLQQKMVTNDKFLGHWQSFESDPSCFFIHTAEFQQIRDKYYKDMVNNSSQYAPMNFVLVLSPNSQKFMILQFGQHGYCDGAGATQIFNHILQLHNAYLDGNKSRQDKILKQLGDYHSPSPNQIYSLSNKANKNWLPLKPWQHIKNTVKLLSYKTKDAGPIATPFAQLPNMLSSEKQLSSTPLNGKFDFSHLLAVCQSQAPEVSPNNLACAVIAKAMYLANQQHNKIENPLISFRVIVDILNLGLRKKLLGNYIAYLPVTIDASKSLINMSKDISSHIFEAKMNQQDISMYKLLEFALGSGMAVKANDPVSFIVSHIGNYHLQANPDLLANAKLSDFAACANANPSDLIGAKLNNRPTICFNLNQQHELFIGMFHSLTKNNLKKLFFDCLGNQLTSIEESKKSIHKPTKIVS
ncbi:hypothetical protein C1E23_19205 [Pseudoalteromonas phenolica]|uniref:Condensation domain-containing protein n=1 Tax=Pseudoalteromonas phenolica TaxID=161398 RepID=A0A4Q7IIT7_9GAMM|nr:hypothetical protein [Pseudoalteromonas phenolica]RZQ51495.1 hypothetical protein C1E23_19205 [Pseudoalteromonas phenolica]